MDWLKKLQEKYKAGKLTEEQYKAKVKDLLDDQDISQEEHDEGVKYDPKATNDAIYTEEEMQRMAYNVARRLIRKTAKEKGLEIDADNKTLVEKIVELAVNGRDGKGATATEAEVTQLRKDAAKTADLQKKLNQATLELGVITHVSAFNPHNPARVVRALRDDYADLLDIDEDTGAPSPASVKSALKQLAKAEPNLFKEPEGAGNEDESGGQGNQGSGGGFRGKPPGGAGAAGGSGGAKKGEEITNEALKMLGIEAKK